MVKCQKCGAEANVVFERWRGETLLSVDHYCRSHAVEELKFFTKILDAAAFGDVTLEIRPTTSVPVGVPEFPRFTGERCRCWCGRYAIFITDKPLCIYHGLVSVLRGDPILRSMKLTYDEARRVMLEYRAIKEKAETE